MNNREYNRQYYLINKEKLLKQSDEYYNDHKEQINSKKRELCKLADLWKNEEFKRRQKEGLIKAWKEGRMSRSKPKISVSLKEYYRTHQHPAIGTHRHHSVETRQKISKKVKCLMTFEFRQKLSAAHKQENHVTINYYPTEYFLIRPSIYRRDNYRCVECNNKNILMCHHKDLNKFNNSSDNLQILCGRCHSLLHWKITKEKGSICL